jgi:hypothetical protein
VGGPIVPAVDPSRRVTAEVIQEVWGNGILSDLHAIIREAAAIVTAYVLGLRESIVMSLLMKNVTITEDSIWC